MSPLKTFREIRKGGYNRTRLGVDWKVVNKILLFEDSEGRTDWIFNFLSAFRIPWRLGGKWFLFPFGAWVMWLSVVGEVKRLVKAGEVEAFGGYSQGGWFAADSSAMTGLPAVTFGCPRLGLGDPTLFDKVTHYQNPSDIVTTVPSWGKTYGTVVILGGEFRPKVNPDISDYVEMASGHSPDEYEQRLEAL